MNSEDVQMLASMVVEVMSNSRSIDAQASDVAINRNDAGVLLQTAEKVLKELEE